MEVDAFAAPAARAATSAAASSNSSRWSSRTRGGIPRHVQLDRDTLPVASVCLCLRQRVAVVHVLVARVAVPNGGLVDDFQLLPLFGTLEPERFFVQVAEQMERFNADVSSFERAFHETPEVLNAVGVNVID